jgi:adenylate cyclase
MLASLLGDSAELDQLKQMVTERTGGNPFFIEEILRALFDEGALVRNGRVSVSRPLSQFRLPPTVQGILASRIDRQPGGHKQLLQTLAVLGMESTLGLIRQVSSMAESQLERTLSDLRAAEFIYEQPASVGVEYTFKHALTQEVAYNSVLSERRRQLHEQAAQAIETLSAANLADQYDDLAHHYGRSGNATKAVKYLHLAAQQSASRGAYAEAGNQLNHALELLQTQPEEMERDRIEIALRIDLNLFTKFSGVLGTAANMENLERAAQLCQHVGDDITRFHILEALADQYFSLADFQKCRTLSEEMLGIATRTLNPEFEGRARFMLGASFQWKGSLVAASEQLELACTLSAGASPIRESLGWNLSSRARLASGSTLWFLGFPERAMARNAEALAIERNMKALPSSMALTLFWSSLFQLSCARNWRIARAHCDEGLRLADEHGLVLMVPVFEFGRGWALARLGQVEEGFAEMRRGGGTFLGGALFRPTFFSGLADACLASGRWQEGLEAVEHAPGPEMRRLKGELLLMANQGSVAEATQCFLDALEMARHLRAKSWELRAAMSFARLLRDTGRRDEARTMLAQIYNWFTEGFDTADLKEAKALLDELAT